MLSFGVIKFENLVQAFAHVINFRAVKAVYKRQGVLSFGVIKFENLVQAFAHVINFRAVKAVYKRQGVLSFGVIKFENLVQAFAHVINFRAVKAVYKRQGVLSFGVIKFENLVQAFAHVINFRAVKAVYKRQRLENVTVGCCGMAGTYGHETKNLENSLGIYQLSWQQALQKLPLQRCLATGYSCRSQVKRVEGSPLRHPLQALLQLI